MKVMSYTKDRMERYVLRNFTKGAYTQTGLTF